jgi:hypothetical protein
MTIFILSGKYLYGYQYRDIKEESGGKEATAALQVQVKEPGFRRRRVMSYCS